MIASMTGFALVNREVPGGRLGLELRSVNHRYLEFQCRMPDELRLLETHIREAVAAKLTRGKVDCRISFNKVAGATNMTPNPEAVVRLTEVIPTRNPAWTVETGTPAESSAPYRVYNIGNS